MINIYNITKSLLCLCTFAGATTWGTENLKELLNNKHNKAETAPPPSELFRNVWSYEDEELNDVKTQLGAD